MKGKELEIVLWEDYGEMTRTANILTHTLLQPTHPRLVSFARGWDRDSKFQGEG